MRRGDVVVVSAPGDHGKPRPAIVVQSDLFNETHASIAVCLLTSDIIEAPLFRLTVEPTAENGLRSRSQIMVDKVVALRRERVGKVIGSLDRDTVLRVNRSLALWLGLGD
ncbi:MAG: type II toxin-antitoxin system PemK/MazF family toxin [Hyphomicrobiaceae bacterium]|nr:MAG: type II toxin-antitoxin system PemK/MazF family toxin [Hyphomicrobiaceae bacterium]